MVLKVGCEVEQNLIITINYDDETSKTNIVSEGDLVAIAYNRNGSRREITGTVCTIHANPYNGQLSKKDWYIIISNNDPEIVSSCKINISSIIDINVIRKKRGTHPVNTPNNAMRVTDIRIKDNYLQVSSNDGKTWRTVGINEDGSLNDDHIGSDKTIADKINALIGDDQYSSSEEFIDGIIDIINQEVRKRKHNRLVSSVEDPGTSCYNH
jgi:hypothetical protein